MICINCGDSTKVTNSRTYKKPSVWRRRQCTGCRKVFSTREKPDLELSTTVNNEVKGSKKTIIRSEPFSEHKLFLSIYECLSHREDAVEAAIGLTETTINKLLLSQASLDKKIVANTVYEVLQRFDEPAAVYYKSHRRDLRPLW